MAEQEEQQSQQVDLQALVQFVENASAKMASQDEQIKALENRLTQATAEPEYEPRETVPQVSEEDIESMSNGQLLNLMEQRFNASLNNTLGDALKPVREGMQNQQQLNIDNQVQSEIAGLQKQYSDFNHFANKAADLVEQRNQAGFKLSIEDAYKLAKAENPDMVNEFKDSQPKPTLAGGLLPPSRLIGQPSSGSNDLDFDQAAERAFQEEVVNEGLAGLFSTEESTSHSPPLKE